MRTNKPHKVTLAEMFRDVLVAAINKGQLPQATLALVAVAIILRMPGEDVSVLVGRVFDGLREGYYLGWVLAMLALIGWSLHARGLRSRLTREIQRVAKERTKAQKARISEPIKSSEKPIN